jgi:hypothetical protein
MTVIQSVLFDREKWSLPEAKAWLQKHKLKTDVDAKPNHFRFRQMEPRKGSKYRTIEHGGGIEFVVMYTRKY